MDKQEGVWIAVGLAVVAVIAFLVWKFGASIGAGLGAGSVVGGDSFATSRPGGTTTSTTAHLPYGVDQPGTVPIVSVTGYDPGKTGFDRAQLTTLLETNTRNQIASNAAINLPQ